MLITTIYWQRMLFLSSLFSLNFQFLNLRSVAPFQFVICSILDFSEALCSIVWRHLGKWRTLKLFRKLFPTTKLWRKKYFSPFNRIPERTRKETESQRGQEKKQNPREDKKRNRIPDTQKLQNPRWTKNKQEPVSTMQKTGLANHSSFLARFGLEKGFTFGCHH